MSESTARPNNARNNGTRSVNASRNNRTRRNRMPQVVENTANSRLRHFNASGREVPINNARLPRIRFNPPMNASINSGPSHVVAPISIRPSTVEEAPRPEFLPLPLPVIPAIPRAAIDFKSMFTKDFGKIDLDRELASFNYSRFGTAEAHYLRNELKIIVEAVKFYFKKIHFIHIVFQMDALPRYNTSGTWTGSTSRSINPYVHFIDSYGNVYTPYLISRGEVPHHLRVGYFLFDIESFSHLSNPRNREEARRRHLAEFGFSEKSRVAIANVDEDKIIAEQAILPDKYISLIKSTVPKEQGSGFGGTAFNPMCVRYAVQAARDIKTNIDEIERLNTLVEQFNSSLTETSRIIAEHNALLSRL